MQGLARGHNLTIEWLPAHNMHRILHDTAKRFGKKQKNDPNVIKFGLIQSEVWMAKQGLQSFPHISVARDDSGIVVGVMCGFPFFDQFFIQHIASHPDFSGIQDEIEEQLVESAIDESMRLGFRGWVASAPDPDEEHFWHNHGFSRQSDGVFKRMGYFVRS